MATKITSNMIKDVLSGADTVSVRGGVFTARREFFYTNGCTAEKFAKRVESEMVAAGYGITITGKGEVWKRFNGGASTKNSSHWWVTFTINQDRTIQLNSKTEFDQIVAGDTVVWKQETTVDGLRISYKLVSVDKVTKHHIVADGLKYSLKTGLSVAKPYATIIPAGRLYAANETVGEMTLRKQNEQTAKPRQS